MKELTIKTYTYGELSPEAQAKSRDWYREYSAGDTFFAKPVKEYARQIASYLGFDVKDIYWSGFYSQGDGACFIGRWSASAVHPGKVKEYAPEDKELHRIADVIESIAKETPEHSFSITHRGNYCHSMSVSYDHDDLTEITSEQESSLEEAAKDLMDWIYDQFEIAYEHEQEDETVAENIEANEYMFTEEGERTFTL